MHSDQTWEVIDNWYWRSVEVCIGIIAASIPALRPGYRTLSSSITSYLSHRSSRKASAFALINSENHLQPHSDVERLACPGDTNYNAFGVAAHTASVEADRANAYGAGEEGFAMKSLPGDNRPVDQGIKKMTTIDVNLSRPGENERTLGSGDPASR